MATSQNYKLPPGFDKGKSYENWKNEVEMWKRVTDLDKRKQALAVALSLKGRARDIALEIPADDLDKDNGMTTLIQELDNLFMREEKDQAYEAYSEFDRISRKDDVPMGEYIADFEHKYNKIRKFNMILPDAVLAFKLLDTAVLDVKEKQLALTACGTHTFADMKSALKRVFGQSSQARGPFAGTNPLDKFGRRTKYGICQSTYHWVKDCPHKKEHVKMTRENQCSEKPDECNITLFSKESDYEIVAGSLLHTPPKWLSLGSSDTGHG